MNTPHVVYYSEWAREKFFIRPPCRSYVDTWLVVHEVVSVMVFTDLFGVPKRPRATIVIRCGGGLDVPIERLRETLAVSCWECLSR